jgi:hypothetical protein
MNCDEMMRQIRSGIGQGHLNFYVPSWRLSRANITRFGTQSIGPLPGYHRASNFRLIRHRTMALVVLWAGAHDVREYYPLWPFPHPHPLYGCPFGEPVESSCFGMLDIAPDLRSLADLTRRGCAVDNISIMVTAGEKQHPRATMIACPTLNKAALSDPNGPNIRTLELGRRFAEANDLGYRVIDASCFDATFVANIQALSFSVNAVRREIAPQLLPRIMKTLVRRLEDNAIVDAVELASSDLQLPVRSVWTTFDFAAWTQTIDIDLRLPIFHTQPVVPGGRRLKADLQHLILGEL